MSEWIVAYDDDGNEEVHDGLVRCKDCKHRRIDGFCKKYQRNIDGSTTMWFAPDDYWYCADGEKVTE